MIFQAEVRGDVQTWGSGILLSGAQRPNTRHSVSFWRALNAKSKNRNVKGPLCKTSCNIEDTCFYNVYIATPFLIPAAVKYGERKKGYPDPATGATRWVYTLGNLVYITDETSTIEITSYCREEQIPLAGLTPGDLLDHARAKDNLKENPRLCTSHTVIVVDHSASMRKPDVLDHENRIKASFGMLALDFVAEQMVSRAACNTDVVSVMLMHDGVDVLFER